MSTAALRRIENDYRESQTGTGNFEQRIGDIVASGSASKYEINVIRFPDNLGSQELQHYISFSINIRGKSKFNTGNNRLFEVRRNNAAQLSADELATAGKALGVAAGAVVGASIGAMAAKKVTESVPKTGAKPNTAAKSGGSGTVDKIVVGTGAAVGAGVGGAVANKILDQGILQPDTSYRISDVIALHIEEKPTVKYSAQYSNKDLGTLAGVIGQIGGSDLGATLQNAMNIGGEASQAAMMGLAKLPSMFGGTDVKSIISASSKTALNPFREVLFEAVDFRTFSFKYRFMPKNRTEVQSIQDIVRLFKFHMHPELSENRLFFIYPGEFQIAYYFGNNQNSYFHKFAPAVLTDLNVDYGGETFASFKDGAPSEVNISMTFRETEILTKEKIVEGY